MKPIVAIVGRPNVGKSTLFNRIIQRRLAIVEDTPGITRDRIYADADWNGREFTLVDTGGLQMDEDEGLPAGVRRQAEVAIAEADLIVLVLDVREGLTAVDRDVAELLRRTKKPVLLAANKAEAGFDPGAVADFYELGLGDPVPISAAHGMNTGDLLDEVVGRLPAPPAEEVAPAALRVAVIGRPNVGKSSLVNAICGQERALVSDIPGTTRDAVDVLVRRGEQNLVLIDTAGMRRKARIDLPVEHYSVLRALRAVDRSDVVLVVIDAVDGLTEQDKKIAGYAHEAGKGAVIVVNKWDLVDKSEHPAADYEERVRRGLAFMDYAPIVFVSALTGQRIGRLLDTVLRVGRQHAAEVATAQVNALVDDAQAVTPPPAERGKRLKIYYCTQGGTRPPTFLFFVNDPRLVHFSYRRYLENRLRQAFGFEGTPIVLIFKRRT